MTIRGVLQSSRSVHYERRFTFHDLQAALLAKAAQFNGSLNVGGCREAIPLRMNIEGWEKDTDARLCKRKLEQGRAIREYPYDIHG